jgi:spore coat protein U-like protein
MTCTNGGACTNASTQTVVIPITAPPAAGCTVSSSNLDFGVYAASATTARTSQATIIAHCPAGEPYMIGLSAGSYPGATTTSRRMAVGGATDTLSYGLYTDPAGTVNWGDSFAGAPQDVVLSAGTGADQEFPVFGRIGPGQYVRAGQYQDTVVVTLQF